MDYDEAKTEVLAAAKSALHAHADWLMAQHMKPVEVQCQLDAFGVQINQWLAEAVGHIVPGNWRLH